MKVAGVILKQMSTTKTHAYIIALFLKNGENV